MNQNNLYYKRGMYILDKMLKTFSNDSTFYSKRFDFLITELKRSKINYQLVHKDINSFNISAIVALLGINKENIEILDKHNNYENLYFTKEQKDNMYLDVYYKLFPEFLNDRNINTIFDDWLSVEKCDYPTLSYMMNIRNGLLHSEYEPLDEFGCLCSIDNSNYTHFKSKVITSGISNFCIFYFGNNSWTGLSENFEIYKMNDHTTPIKDVQGLRKILTEELEVNYITYQSDSKTTNNKSPERKVYNVIESHRKNYRGELEDLLNKKIGPNIYSIE